MSSVLCENLAPSPHLECFADDLYVEWVRYNSKLSTFVNLLNDLLVVILEIEAVVEQLRQLLVHKHTRHYHPDLHEVDVFGNGYAPGYHYKSDPPHTCFFREKDSSEDIDGNNKICGYDFLIADGPKSAKMMRYDTYLDIPNNIEWLFYDKVMKNEVFDYHPGGNQPIDARAVIGRRDLTGTTDGQEILMIMSGYTINFVNEFFGKRTYIDNLGWVPIVASGTGGAGVRWDSSELRKDNGVTEISNITFVDGVGYYTTGGTGSSGSSDSIGVNNINTILNTNIAFIDNVGYYKTDMVDSLTGETSGITITSLIESVEFPSPNIPINIITTSDLVTYYPGTLNYGISLNSSGGDSGLMETNIPYEKDISDFKITMNLIKEIISVEDKDSNGLIYNVDFYIPDVDKDKPLLITEIEKSSNLIPSKKAKEVSMQHFLSTLGLGKYKQDLIDTIILPGKFLNMMIKDLIDEVLTGKDVDNDGLVYGRDFIIMGDDTPVPLLSKYPLLMPDILMTWDAYLCYALDKFNGQLNGVDYLNLLKQEYDNNIDLDGNGLIYGYDFRFNPDHPGNPENTFDILPQINVSGIYKSWKAYIFELPNIPMEINGYMMEELSVKLSSEHHYTEDVDNNGLIYGQHFIISDYDQYKSDCLWQLETTMNLVRDPEVYNYLSTKYLPRGVREEYTIAEWNQYWELTGGTGGTGNCDYKESLNINQCICIERKSSNLNAHEFMHKFVLIMTWADLLIVNNEIDIIKG